MMGSSSFQRRAPPGPSPTRSSRSSVRSSPRTNNNNNNNNHHLSLQHLLPSSSPPLSPFVKGLLAGAAISLLGMWLLLPLYLVHSDMLSATEGIQNRMMNQQHHNSGDSVQSVAEPRSALVVVSPDAAAQHGHMRGGAGGIQQHTATTTTTTTPQQQHFALRHASEPLQPNVAAAVTTTKAQQPQEAIPNSSSSAAMNLKLTDEVIDMRELNYQLPFDNPDGGAWKQGWDVTPQVVDATHPLTIFVVPHSHCDPGWIKTFDEYFQTQTKQILTTVVRALSKDERRKFIWAEISYFEWWWREQDSQTRDVTRRLIRNKQLEFVTGGWVQPDEANTQLYAMEVQLQEGHDFLRATFGDGNDDDDVIPKYGWSIDPFGYSPTMAYLLKKYNFRGMLIQRVHYAIKKELAKRQHLEFMWRQTWDAHGTHDMFAHVMPFYSYDVPHTCGPDPAVCCQFDFARLLQSRTYGSCPWKLPPQVIDEDNVKNRAMLLLDQYQKKASLYRSNVVIAPLGDDFRWRSDEEAELQYTNYQKIMDYLNAHVPGVTMQFGTLSDYFTSVMGQFDVPVLKGSFFTYSDREQDYWSGYFTSRVFDKALDRQLERVLVAAESLGATRRELQEPRRALSLFQHHDGVTGTAKTHVVQDYAARIHKAIRQVQEWIQHKLLALENNHNNDNDDNNNNNKKIEPCWQSDAPRGLSINLCDEGNIDNNGTATNKEVYVYNPLETAQYCGSVEVAGHAMEKATLPCETPGAIAARSKHEQPPCQFDETTGLMTHPIKEEWMVWKVRRGGAYLFFPDTLQSYNVIQQEDLQIEQDGFVVSTPHWKRTVVQRAVSDEFGSAATVYDFVYETFLQTPNEEWFVRFSSKVQNHGIFHTDLNGFNFDTHHFRKDMPIQSQVFPMPTLACIEDDKLRMTVLSEHAQGTASLQDGSIDVWLDRRLNQDDDRGLGQGVLDNVPTRTRLRIVLEQEGMGIKGGEFDITPLTRRMWDELNHPLEMFGSVHRAAPAEAGDARVAERRLDVQHGRQKQDTSETDRQHHILLEEAERMAMHLNFTERDSMEDRKRRIAAELESIVARSHPVGNNEGGLATRRGAIRVPAPPLTPAFTANVTGAKRQPIVPIVLLVFQRVDYLKKVIDSLRASDFDGSRVPLIISHDGHVPEMMEYVQTLVDGSDFWVIQIVHPYSCHDHPHSFPGDDPAFQNDTHVDSFGHKRDAKATCCKHHFTWMLKTVFDMDFDGKLKPDAFLFSEEDYIVGPTVYEAILTGLDLYHQYTSVHGNDTLFGITLDPTDGFTAAAPSQSDRWTPRSFLTGPMVMTRSIYQQFRQHASEYCTFDEYNWDWTFVYLMTRQLLPHTVLTPSKHQVMHIGFEGMHGEAGVSAGVRKRMHDAQPPEAFHGTELYLPSSLAPSRKHPKGFGGWAHPADQNHCLDVLLVEEVNPDTTTKE